MKVIMALALSLSIAVTALATDMRTVNDSSLEAFLAVYPRYMSLAEEYGQRMDSAGSMSILAEYSEKMERLLADAGMSVEDFAVLNNKVNVGLAIVHLRNSDAEEMAGAFIEQMSEQVGPEELAVIERHSERIETVLQY